MQSSQVATTLLLIPFKTRPEAVRPRNWNPKRQSLSDHPKPATAYHLKTGQRE
jgi:hypothetical protein